MSVRVIRLMEYTYPDAEAAVKDMNLWAVQGFRRFSANCRIKSTTLGLDFFAEDDSE